MFNARKIKKSAKQYASEMVVDMAPSSPTDGECDPDMEVAARLNGDLPARRP